MTNTASTGGRPAPRSGRRRRLGIATGAALMGSSLVLAGCDSDDDKPATAPTESAYLLQEYVSEIYSGVDLVAQARLQQDFIATCMGEAGFEYIPSLAGPLEFTLPEPDDWAAFQLVEGWGVTAGQTGVGMENPAALVSLTGQTASEPDPNLKIALALSPAAREAYYAAFLDVGGCNDQATAEYSIESALATTSDLLALYEEIFELYASDGTDPRTIEIAARWAQCMTDSGYLGYTTPGNASSTFEEALPPVDGEVTPDEIEAQRADEVAAAAADLACRTDLDYDAITDGIRIAREQEFLEENRKELDALLLTVRENTPRLPETATP